MEKKTYEILGRFPALPDLTDPAVRQRTLGMVVDTEYGGFPPAPARVEVQLTHMAGSHRIENYLLHITAGNGRVVLPLQIFFPEQIQDRIPVILTGDGCFHKMTDDVIAAINGAGMAAACFDRTILAPDVYTDDRSYGIYPLFPELRFGALAAWAWGYSRAMDALLQIDSVDPARVAITGHSRGGKTVLLAGVADPRFPLVNPNCSGTAGGSPFRYRMMGREDKDRRNEWLSDMIPGIAYWLGPDMRGFVGRETELPFDQHFLKALVAPRTLLETVAEADIWSNPEGARMTCAAAAPAFAAAGVPERLLFHARQGGHAHGPEDFDVLISVARHCFFGDPLPASLPHDPYGYLADIQERLLPENK